VRELLELAFGDVELQWQDHVAPDEHSLRPADFAMLVGDAGKARRVPEPVAMMVGSDLRTLS
jgi:GDPmannose 4,6-dehydratase